MNRRMKENICVWIKIERSTHEGWPCWLYFDSWTYSFLYYHCMNECVTVVYIHTISCFGMTIAQWTEFIGRASMISKPKYLRSQTINIIERSRIQSIFYRFICLFLLCAILWIFKAISVHWWAKMIKFASITMPYCHSYFFWKPFKHVKSRCTELFSGAFSYHSRDCLYFPFSVFSFRQPTKIKLPITRELKSVSEYFSGNIQTRFAVH